MVDDDTPQIDGRVEALRDGLVTGWAWNPSEPESAVGVAVVVDGAVVASGPADLEAPGLSAIGVGDGNHAFAIELPERLADGGSHRLTVLAGRHDDVVPSIRDWERSMAGVWAQTEFVFVEADQNAPQEDFGAIDEASSAAHGDPSAVALVGKRAWLFGLGPADIRRLTAVRWHGSDPVEAWQPELEKTADALHVLGIRHVVAIVPSKLCVYPEFAPRGAALAATDRPGRRVFLRAHDSDRLLVIDLIDALLGAKGQGWLFHRRAESWNALGAFVAHRSILKHAGVRGLTPLSLTDTTFLASMRPPRGSLEDLPRVALGRDDLLKVDPLAPTGDDDEEVVAAANLAALHAKRMPTDGHLEIEGLPAPRVYVREDAPDRPRVVVLGHPCIHELTPWIAETASRLVVLSTPTAVIEQIELEFPDVVLQVLDEKYLAEGVPSPGHVVDSLADESLDSPTNGLAVGPAVEDVERGEESAGGTLAPDGGEAI